MENKIEIRRGYWDGEQIKFERSFLNKKLHGKEKYFNPDGIIKDMYTYDNGQLQGIYMHWNDNESINNFGYNKNHSWHGPRIDFKYK